VRNYKYWTTLLTAYLTKYVSRWLTNSI